MKSNVTQVTEKVIQINEGAIRDHLGALVRSTVEEMTLPRSMYQVQMEFFSCNIATCSLTDSCGVISPREL